MSDVKYSVWLSLIAIPGSRSVCRLIEAFHGDAEAIYRATKEDYLAVDGVKESLADALCDKSMEQTLRTVDLCRKRRIGILPFDSPQYPKRLRRIPDFPILLYYRGTLPDIDSEVAIATVGTRRITEYGQQNAYVISRDLARAGTVIVSGMASGVDSVCHRGALDALGHTIAVLGCGIDIVYPKHNADLMEEIARTGTLFSEYPPGTPPAGYNFPKRNRIISGLSLGTLVVEADEKSGAMITARIAREQGRDLFALPGNVGEMNSLGTNKLIKDGARMVTSALDLLDEYELIFPQKIHTERLITGVSNIYIEPQKHLRVASVIAPIRDDRDKTNTSGIYRASSAGEELKEEPKKAKKQKNKDKKTSKAPTNTQKALPDDLTEEEKSVLEAMPDGQSVTTDEIARKGIPVPSVLVALTTLEIKRLVVSLPGGNYMKNL